MNYGICFLAYGKEHIDEFNIVAKSLLEINKDFKIFVATNEPDWIIDGIYKIIKIYEEFNFNLKRIVIEHALNEVNTILFLDTDVFVMNDADFSIINNVKNNTFYAAEIVGLNKLKDVYGSLDYMKEYLDILVPMIDTSLLLVHEGMFILNVSGKEKEEFLNIWKEIDLQTKPYQKMAYGLLGAMEGIIIYISLLKSNVVLKQATDNIMEFYYHIAHFGSRGRKLIKTIL